MLIEEIVRYRSDVEKYLINSSGVGIVLIDTELTILDCNLGFMRLFHPWKKPIGVSLSDFLKLSDINLFATEEFRTPCKHISGMDGIVYCCRIRVDGGFMIFCERLIITESRALEQIGAMNDELIAIQRELVKKNYLLEKLKVDLDQRVAELESTQDRVKVLEGIIPICMYCKKIRDDNDYWHKLENYISEHSDALFSHSICPTCLQEHYPEEKKC